MRILIAGLPRSGTTFLYSIVVQSIPGGFAALFEPSPELLVKATESYRASTANGVVKIVLTDQDYAIKHEHFDKKILLVRDPRDNLISALLYSTLHSNFIHDSIKREKFLTKLRQKEQDPKKVSMLELIALRDALEGTDFIVEVEKQRQISLDYHLQNPDVLIFRYPDLVRHELRTAESYLGFPLNFQAEVPKVYKRVLRAGHTEDWPNWFTKEDLSFFKHLYLDYLNLYHLSDSWTESNQMKISPAECSEYVQKLITEALEAS